MKLKRILIFILTMSLFLTCLCATPTYAAIDTKAVTFYTVTVNVNPGVASVTVSSGLSDQTFTENGTMRARANTVLSWTATPQDGYEMNESEGSLTVTSNWDEISPTATLKITNYTVTVTLNTGVESIEVEYGSETKTFTSNGTLTLPSGTSLFWTATAATGYTLNIPSGSFILSSDQTISPTTRVSTYKLTVTINSNVASITVNYGSSSQTFTSSGSLTIEHGTSVSWTGKAKTGYKLSATSGSFTMTGAKTIAPTASIRSYKLTITVNEGVDYIVVNGTRYTSSSTVTLKYGTSVSWTASPKAGYTLSASSGSFKMTKARTIAPTSTQQTYTLTVTVNTGVSSIAVTYGSSSKTFTSSGTLTVTHGTAVSWTATAATGYNLTTSSSGNFTMTAATSVAPMAALKSYTLTVTVNTGVSSIVVTYGSSTKTFTSSGTLTVTHGTAVSWIASASTGYNLSSSSGSFTMIAATSVAPTASLKSYTLTVTVNTGVSSIAVTYGSSSKTFTSSGTLTVTHGTSVSWTTTAKTGYTVTSNGGGGTNITGNYTISPTAAINTYTVQFFVNGKVAKTVTVNYGEKVSSFTPNVVGYDFGGWYSNSGLTNAFNFDTAITSNVTIYAKMTVKTFTISITSYIPTNADPQFGWKLEWASGKSLTGAVSDYVTLTVASNKLSVTLTFKKDFTGGEMVLTCYSTLNSNVKATVKVTCGS